ncbi:MAG: hypothetical protein KGJ73_03805, partial [Rhodospirillales bacterium]|nr:hypothetical protein [Rhodospirillales bacterium]
YKNIMVGGYPGTVGSTTGQKMVFAKIINDSQNLVDVDSDGEYGLPTKGRIIWFNSQGKEV